jgi:hypothetical protein
MTHHTRQESSGRGIGPSQSAQSTRDRHPCPRRNSNPQSQQANGRKPGWAKITLRSVLRESLGIRAGLVGRCASTCTVHLAYFNAFLIVLPSLVLIYIYCFFYHRFNVCYYRDCFYRKAARLRADDIVATDNGASSAMLSVRLCMYVCMYVCELY